MTTIRKYGKKPYLVALLHGGPGAPGDMKPVAEELSRSFGVIELLQTKNSVNGLIKELYNQLLTITNEPIILIGHSWGAWLGFIFTSAHPNMVRKLFMVGAGSFDKDYNKEFSNIRFERLNKAQKSELREIIQKIEAGTNEKEILVRFSELMTIADSFEYQELKDEEVIFQVDIFRSVWYEASRLRDNKELLAYAEKIECPVTAIHGDYDPHPIEGVEIPLSNRLKDFKMIKLEKCGHTPWKERHARERFFEILREEILAVTDQN